MNSEYVNPVNASNVLSYISYCISCLYYNIPFSINVYSIKSVPNILKFEYTVIVYCSYSISYIILSINYFNFIEKNPINSLWNIYPPI